MSAPISHAAAAAKNRRNALPLTSLDAARHLRRMSLGPKATEIVGLTGGSVSQYVASQFNMVVSRSTFDTTLSRGELGRPNLFDNNSNSGLMAQMVKLLSAPDTLRNRIAFALSEMFVVSRTGNDWSVTHLGDAIAAYNDILCAGVTGSFRVMIESIARSPAMSLYLTHFCNQKASNGREPDQNFAREIMQLFCIGLYELNLDGTRVKAGELQPSDPRYIANSAQDVATYTNIDIVNVARVFTGMCLPNPQGGPAFAIQNPALFDDQTLVQNGWASRLVFDPLYHESTLPKVALQGRINIPVGVGGDISLTACLDALVAHPSTAPFIAGRMIRLLMTSNPTPAYVARVASVFRNDGTGAVGNMGAMFKAIFTDQDAMAPPTAGLISRVASQYQHIGGAWRQHPATPDAAGGMLGSGFIFGAPSYLQETFGLTTKEIYRAPSVFNSFLAGYSPAGPIKDAGLQAQEMQQYDETGAAEFANSCGGNLATAIQNTMPASELAVFPTDASPMTELPAMIQRLNFQYCGGSAPAFFTEGLRADCEGTDFSQRQGLQARQWYASIATALLTSPWGVIRN